MVLIMTAWTAHVTVATVVEKDGKFLFVEEHGEGVSTHPAAGSFLRAETMVYRERQLRI